MATRKVKRYNGATEDGSFVEGGSGSDDAATDAPLRFVPKKEIRVPGPSGAPNWNVKS